MDARQEAIFQKRMAIFESVVGTANQITRAAAGFPKKNKYFFKRKNIRGLSRQNKRKHNLRILEISLAAYIGRAQVMRIASQPIPKYKTGF